MSNNKDNLDFETILASSIHDMKNSLAMLLGSIEDITNQCKPDTCTAHENLLNIQNEGKRVNNDLIKLLTLYRIDRSQYTINITEICVNDFLNEIALEYSVLLKSYGIQLEIQCEPDLYGFFDYELVAGAIKTIITNAYQYAKNTIRLIGQSENGYTVLSVTDNGPGYPQHILYNDKTHAGGINFGTGSTGLGLYFSHRVAELHKNKGQQGFVQVSNDGIQNGGCFKLYLP